MGQKKSTAERRHNKKRAGAGPHVLLDAGVGSGCRRGRWLVFSGGIGIGQKGGERRLISLLLVRMVSRTMFGCAGSEVTATIVGTYLHNSISAACSYFIAVTVSVCWWCRAGLDQYRAMVTQVGGEHFCFWLHPFPLLIDTESYKVFFIQKGGLWKCAGLCVTHPLLLGLSCH